MRRRDRLTLGFDDMRQGGKAVITGADNVQSSVIAQYDALMYQARSHYSTR